MLTLIFCRFVITLFTRCALQRYSFSWHITALLKVDGLLFNDFSDDTGTNCTSTLTDSEMKFFLHGDRCNQLNIHCSVITRHNHFHTLCQLNRPSHISCSEVELRTITSEERCMTSTFFFGENVNFALNFYEV